MTKYEIASTGAEIQRLILSAPLEVRTSMLTMLRSACSGQTKGREVEIVPDSRSVSDFLHYAKYDRKLGRRAAEFLLHNNIKTMGDLADLSEHQVFGGKGMGHKSVEELRLMLSQYYLTFRRT